MCSKTTTWTLQLSRSQGSLERAQFRRRKEDTHSSGLLPAAVHDQIQTLHIPLQGKCHLTIVNVYAPTLTNPNEVKEAFYSELKTTIISVATSDKLKMLGDSSAQVGRGCTVWPGVTGHWGVSSSDSSGLLLLLCAQNSNCASTTQCSDCQIISNAHGCIPVQKAGISLTMSLLNRETFLGFKSPRWGTGLVAQQVTE